MARIPDELIEQVRDAADLLEIVQEQVQLKRTGSDWRGPCPFHGGTNRNFAVIPKDNYYYCFVCHESGDVFTWYRKRLGMDYPTAVREVARRVGILIPENTERAGPDPREPLFQACDAAQSWFAAQLREGTEAENARRYLLKREFSLDAAATLGMGHAPRANDFVPAMKQLGIADDVLVEAGLAVKRDDGTIAPRFRGRLLFPIHDLRGRVVGFGGRILGAGEPKYLNSPETSIFRKGEQLYHMHLAKHAIRKAECAVLVEGYFDVQRLALVGIEHVVAPLGTSLTEAQAVLLKRLTNEVVLLYDSDTPGLKATFRAGDILLSHGVRVRVATLPTGEDPDTLAQRGGAAAIEQVLGDAIDLLERKLQLLDVKGWFGDVHKAREALDRLLPTLRAATDSVTRELYVSRVAERLGIPREAVAAEAARRGAPASAPPARVVVPRDDRAEAGSAQSRLPGAEIERKLLRLLALDPTWLARARDEVDPGLFQVPTFHRVFKALVALPPDAPPSDVVPLLDAPALDAWSKLVEAGLPGSGYDFDREYADGLAALEESRLFANIDAETDQATKSKRRARLSKEGETRYSLYLKSKARARDNDRPPPPEE
jgi:DNA primase